MGKRGARDFVIKATLNGIESDALDELREHWGLDSTAQAMRKLIMSAHDAIFLVTPAKPAARK